MSDEFIRYPMLEMFYQQYLTSEHSADFIQSVSSSYTVGSLERLARHGQCLSRRAAVLAIGFLGDFSCNETLGRALVDDDRCVRMLADHGVREIWPRQGTPAQQSGVTQLYRLNAVNRTEDAIDLASSLICENHELGEAWNQRAIAFCAEGDFRGAIEDCKESLNCNRFHFPAAMGIGHCCLQLDDPVSALEGFRLALRINPDLEGVRSQIHHLERTLEDI
jgi:tetratricopeptide (TPR) repeat protein